MLDPPLPNYYLLGGGRRVSLEGRPPPASEVPLTLTDCALVRLSVPLDPPSRMFALLALLDSYTAS